LKKNESTTTITTSNKEHQSAATSNQFVQFIKIEAPEPFLTKYAEILNLKMPLRPDLVSVINDYKNTKLKLSKVKPNSDVGI